jgi:hypothetical protein
MRRKLFDESTQTFVEWFILVAVGAGVLWMIL